jgi:hypothetical protein
VGVLVGSTGVPLSSGGGKDARLVGEKGEGRGRRRGEAKRKHTTETKLVAVEGKQVRKNNNFRSLANPSISQRLVTNLPSSGTKRS